LSLLRRAIRQRRTSWYRSTHARRGSRQARHFGVVEQFRARLMLACITTKRSTTSSVSCQPAARVPTALERMISDPASPSPSTPPNPPHPPRATVPDHRLASALFEGGAATPRARRPRPADCLCPSSTVGSTAPFTHHRRHLVGNVFPGADVPLRSRPSVVLPATLARKMSPVEMVGKPSRSARTLACVPFAGPGRTHEDEDRQRVFRWLTRGVPSAF
jgi:hypothetical protein